MPYLSREIPPPTGTPLIKGGRGDQTPLIKGGRGDQTPLIKGGRGDRTPLIKGDPPAYRHPPYQGGQGGSNLKFIFNLIITSHLLSQE